MGYTRISAEREQQILELHNAGLTRNAICEQLKCGRNTVMAAIDPSYRAVSNEYARNRQYKLKEGEGFRRYAGDKHAEPPEGVIAERDRVYASRPYDVRYDLLGEPLPGRSALDQKKVTVR